MKFTDEQKRSFYNDGYVVVPGLVEQHLVRRSLRAINHSLGNGMDPALLDTYRDQSYCPELQKSPEILDLLYETPAWSMAEDLTAPDKMKAISTGSHVAIRFPSLDVEPKAPSPHLDGMYTPTNGGRPGDIWSHTLMIGVYLSDVLEENAGSLVVWPGSHHRYEEHFRECGPKSLVDGMPSIDIGEPSQLFVRAGDVAFVHYQVGHAVAPHLGPDVRYAIYFRLVHENHEAWKWETMTDVWLEWDGMRHIALESGRPVGSFAE